MNGIKLKNKWLWITLIPVVVLFVVFIVQQRRYNVQLTLEEQQWLNEHRTLRIAPNPNFAPFDFFEEDGTYNGFTSEFIRLIGKKLGITFSIVRCGSQYETLEAARNLQTDMVTAVTPTPNRLKYLTFTTPLIELYSVIVVRTNDNRTLTLDSLAGKQVVLTRGNFIYEDLQRNHPEIHLIPVSSGLESLYEISFGRGDAAILNIASASYYIDKHGFTNLRVAGRYDITTYNCLAVRNDWPILTGILNKALLSISTDQRSKFARQWLGLYVELEWWEKIPWQWIVFGVALIGIFSFAVLVWNRLLTHQVQVKTTELQQELDERRKIEEALRKSEEELQSIFRASPIGIGVVINRVIIAANDQLCIMTGYSREEILHQNARILYPTDEEYEYVGKEKYRQIREKGTGTVETRWRKKDGSIIDILLSSTPIDTQPENSRVTFTAMDITERKQLAKQLAESQKMESLGTLAGGIAHDFNNILNIIIGYADRLLLTSEGAEKQKENVETIVKAAERAARLIKQILTFARRTTQERAPVNINTIVEEMVRMLYETFPRTIEISIALERYLSPILGDRNQVHQALLNLAVNARDAMPSGGKLIFRTELVEEEKVRSRFPNAALGNYVCISVQDTGAGIDDATTQKIFEPFFTTKEHGKGTGLGLSVVYGIIAGMKGFIDMKSILGQGTTFFIYLPAATVEYSVVQKEISKSEIKGGHETILVIEDEEAARKILVQTLEAKGYHVIVAADGEKALQLYRKQSTEIDLVLSDLGLAEDERIRML